MSDKSTNGFRAAASPHSLCRCPGWPSTDESKRDSRAIGIFLDLLLSLTTLDSSSGQYRRLATRVLLLEQQFGQDGGPNGAHNQLFFTAGPNIMQTAYLA